MRGCVWSIICGVFNPRSLKSASSIIRGASTVQSYKRKLTAKRLKDEKHKNTRRHHAPRCRSSLTRTGFEFEPLPELYAYSNRPANGDPPTKPTDRPARHVTARTRPGHLLHVWWHSNKTSHFCCVVLRRCSNFLFVRYKMTHRTFCRPLVAFRPKAGR